MLNIYKYYLYIKFLTNSSTIIHIGIKTIHAIVDKRDIRETNSISFLYFNEYITIIGAVGVDINITIDAKAVKDNFNNPKTFNIVNIIKFSSESNTTLLKE